MELACQPPTLLLDPNERRSLAHVAHDQQVDGVADEAAPAGIDEDSRGDQQDEQAGRHFCDRPEREQNGARDGQRGEVDRPRDLKRGKHAAQPAQVEGECGHGPRRSQRAEEAEQVDRLEKLRREDSRRKPASRQGNGGD